jgi:hypothetical protein
LLENEFILAAKKGNSGLVKYMPFLILDFPKVSFPYFYFVLKKNADVGLLHVRAGEARKAIGNGRVRD